MPAALMIGHHFDLGLVKRPERFRRLLARRMLMPWSAMRRRTSGSAMASTAAELSLATISLGVPLGAHSPCQVET